MNLIEEVVKYNIKRNGIIHVGGYQAEEYETYIRLGFNNQIWIEGNKKYYDEIKNKLKNDKNCLVFNEVINDIEELVKFNLANFGASSSILPLKIHKKYYPSIDYYSHIEVKTKRLDTLLNENNIDLKNYNGLSLDIQGVELKALKSLSNLILNFDFIVTEINIEELYEGCCLIDDLDSYLNEKNFNRVSTIMWDNGTVGWGDALYIKNNLL